jgi:hypothetical protein
VTYSNVTWSTVTPASATLLHSGGVTTFPLETLPEELQKRFNYDPERAAAYRGSQPKALVRLDRAATAQALGAAVRLPYALSYSYFVRSGGIEEIRGYYRSSLSLQETGHADYQPAIRSLIYACQRGLELASERKKPAPTVGGLSDLPWRATSGQIAAHQRWGNKRRGSLPPALGTA